MAEASLPSLDWLRKRLEDAEPDLLREMMQMVVAALMGAEVDALCGAGYGEPSPERVNRRNGYRDRPWDTRLGTVPLRIPKLRQGSYFPDWLLEPRRRAERAVVQVVAESYLRGVSVRRIEGLAQALGIDRLSKSRVAAMATELDELVAAFRSRPLDGGPYAYVWLDAHTQRCRDGGRIVNVATVTAIGVNAGGHREVLGCDVITSEDGAGWTAFLRDLVARGLAGVKLVISDDHKGLKQAVAAVFPGAAWQGCRTHFMRNLLTRVPKISIAWAGGLTCWPSS
jgi:transposase-like protein